MVRKLILVIVPLLALLGGAFAGERLRAPLPAAPEEAAEGPAQATTPAAAAPPTPAAEVDWFTFPSQFFVPLVRQGDMSAIMILTLVLETDKGQIEALGRQEYRLRDALLRALMIHANTGGFDGSYTVDRNLQTLRDSLLSAARSATDVPVRAVLIQDLAQQGG
ncbi:MAG: hypothetical protein ACK41U_07190 [Paracoccus sp. (in: a-proteobacteria)]|uniref:hypothetical protein n=1 Tax=Paracoccus sp. TaxID=267 RepID=UPI0039188BAC